MPLASSTVKATSRTPSPCLEMCSLINFSPGFKGEVKTKTMRFCLIAQDTYSRSFVSNPRYPTTSKPKRVTYQEAACFAFPTQKVMWSKPSYLPMSGVGPLSAYEVYAVCLVSANSGRHGTINIHYNFLFKNNYSKNGQLGLNFCSRRRRRCQHCRLSQRLHIHRRQRHTHHPASHVHQRATNTHTHRADDKELL